MNLPRTFNPRAGRQAQSSPPYEGGVAAASADGVVLFEIRFPEVGSSRGGG